MLGYTTLPFFDRDISRIVARPTGLGLHIEGRVLNTGAMTWDNPQLPFGREFRVGLVLHDPDGCAPVHEDRFCFPDRSIPSGGHVDFSFLVPRSVLRSPRVLVGVDVMKESSFWFGDLGALPLRFSYELSEDDTLSARDWVASPTSEYLAEIGIDEFEIAPEGLLVSRGTVVNLGAVSWSESESPEFPTLVGARLLRKSPVLGEGAETVVWEGRYHLDRDPLATGGTVGFRFSCSLCDLSAGNYVFEVGIVRERCFWLPVRNPARSRCAFVWHGSQWRAETEAHKGLGHVLRADAASDPAPVEVVVIAPTLPLFDRQAGGVRLMRVLESMRRQGANVSYLYEGRGCPAGTEEKYLSELARLGVTAHADPAGALHALRERARIDVVILCWPDCARRHLAIVRRLAPEAKVIVDSVDIHWVRESRGSAWEASADGVVLAERKQAERQVYRDADIVWVVSEADRRALHEEVPECATQVVGKVFEDCLPPRIHERTKGQGFTGASEAPLRAVFVGSFKHPPNESSAVWAHEVCAAYRAATSRDVVLTIVGEAPPETIRALQDGERTIVAGHVPELEPVLAASDVMIVPMRFGSGIKGKVLSGYAAGLPVLTNSLGLEGLELDLETEAFCGETTADLVQLLSRVESGGAAAKERVEAGQRRLRQVFSQTAMDVCIGASLRCPRVVIAVVTYNQRELLARCLESVLSLTRYPNYRIEVVSNGCTDGTREYLSTIGARFPNLLRYSLNETNEFFVRPNNRIIAGAGEDDVVLLNNDVEVLHEDWLYHLMSAAYSGPRVAGAGGKVLDKDGMVTEAGAEMYESGRGVQLGRGSARHDSAVSRHRFVGYVSGCLMYMRRDAIAAGGMLDDSFHPMYYEDSAWHYSLRQRGWSTAYTPLVEVIHAESASAAVDASGSKTSWLEEQKESGRRRFLERFKGTDFGRLNPR